MGDAAILTNLGVPTIALITDRFWAQSELVAASKGVPDLPRLELVYPLAGAGLAVLRAEAERVAPLLATSLGLL